LRSFARFATQRGETHVVATTAIDWAKLAPTEAQRHYRLQSVIRFARLMAAEDPRHQIPPHGLFRGQRPRPIPYIFSETEIAQLLLAARQLGPSGSLRPHTYSPFFGLLAATGMRVAEARNLHVQDVTADGLLIRHTKFHESRLLPVHETTRAALVQYLVQRQRAAGLESHLFVTRRHGKLSRTLVNQTLREVLQAAGIPCEAGRPRPRLMDLRHTFAVRTLERSPETREQIGRHTLALTTYMGHACVASTYWYLERTPQLMVDIAATCAAFVYGETI
jgi:site-specific recombinase XerD